MNQHTLVCLMGPTASGKTQLAIELTKHFPFEIISVDSALVYREMNIGTAKPDAATLSVAPHQLIDIRDPSEAYSAAEFRKDALREIEKIIARGKIPLLVGGTMLYFRALTQGLSDLPSANSEVRVQIANAIEQQGLAALHARLAEVDPDAAKRIHPNDTQRISRALEVYEVSGKSLTAWQRESGEVLADFTVINLAIAPHDRAVLHERIARRFQAMLDAGFVEEVRRLYERGDLDLSMPAIRAVGYRQVWEYLQGVLTFDEMRERGVIATRQLAKRQLTWLRHWPDVVWFDSEDGKLYQQVENYLQSVLG